MAFRGQHLRLYAFGATILLGTASPVLFFSKELAPLNPLAFFFQFVAVCLKLATPQQLIKKRLVCFADFLLFLIFLDNDYVI